MTSLSHFIEYAETVKVTLMGDGNVGKTTFAKFIRTNKLIKDYIPTMGVECHPTYLTGNSSKIVTFWDTAGQQKFYGEKEKYWKLSKIIVVMFDVSNKNSIDRIKIWIENAEKECPNAEIIICANKVDKVDYEFDIDNFKYPCVKTSMNTNFKELKDILKIKCQ